MSITPTRSLFNTCFRLSKGSGGYYLLSRGGFRIYGAPSNNKGWKSHYFFISHSQGWGFKLLWSARSVNNTSLRLSNKEFEQLGHLEEILSSSQVIRNMTKEWLVEAGLSLTPRDMV